MNTTPPYALPTLTRDIPPDQPLVTTTGVGFTVINFNTAAQTLRCVGSLVQCLEPPAWVLVLDNASNDADYQRLLQSLQSGPRTQVQLFRSDINLGFAAGSNFLVNQLLERKPCNYIGLLNNDAVALPELVSALRSPLAQGHAMVGMSGGRMHKLMQPDEVDTLGITLYASLMPADRKDTRDPYLGPTGGCCLMTRAFVLDMLATTGYCFDERFFCYCEDTDLVLRANLMGYRPAYVDTLVALHEGQASSGGGNNHFIAYHGLRNALWMQCKLIPASLLWRYALPLLLAHLLTIVRQVISGRSKVLWAIYRDAFKSFGAFYSERKQLQKVRRRDGKLLRSVMSPHFYRQGYASIVLKEWQIRWRKSRR